RGASTSMPLRTYHDGVAVKKALAEVSSVRGPAATQLTWRAWVCWVTGPVGALRYRLTARWVPGGTRSTTASEETERPAGIATAGRPAKDRRRSVPDTMSAPRRWTATDAAAMARGWAPKVLERRTRTIAPPALE